ncbi:integrase, catalytic region, zinc finger, CCHC-type containing protein [Tanacetum coccineum]
MTVEDLFNLLNVFRISLQDRMLVRGKLIQKLSQKGVKKKELFKTCCKKWVEVNPTHHSTMFQKSKDYEDPSWNTVFQDQENSQDNFSFGRLYLIVFVLVRNILIQEFLGYVRDTCPDIHKPSEKLVVVTPINKKKMVRFAEPVISSRVIRSTKSSRSKSTDNIKNDRILQISSSTQKKNKVEDHSRIVVQIVLWYLDSGCSKHMTRDRSQLTNFVHKFLGTVKFGNDQITKIMGYGDYLIGNITISRVYYVEGLGHNLFSVGQFCNSDLEVAFRKHMCFVRNLEGVDLLSGSQETNLYTLSIGDMMVSSAICLLSKASKTKSWPRQLLPHVTPKTDPLYDDAMGKLLMSSYDRKPYLSYLHVLGALCYPNNDSENLGKFQAKSDIGIFIGYEPKKKAYYIYNRRTQKIIETIHFDFDELTAMASEQLDSGPGLQLMTPTTSSSGVVSNPIHQQPFLVGAALRAVDLADLHVSTSIDQDAPSTSIPLTQDQEHSLIISQSFEESPKTPHFHNDPLHESLHKDSTSQGSSSNVRPIHTPFESLGIWTKDHPIANVIGDPSRSVSTRKQLQTDAMWCYFDAFLTSFEPKNFKQAMTELSWIDASKREIHMKFESYKFRNCFRVQKSYVCAN